MSVLFFFKQKTAYEMRISDWSSDVCSSDLFSKRTKCRYRPRRSLGKETLEQPNAAPAFFHVDHSEFKKMRWTIRFPEPSAPSYSADSDDDLARLIIDEMSGDLGMTYVNDVASWYAGETTHRGNHTRDAGH